MQLYGVYLTFRVRNIPSQYNESSHIALALYNIGTLAVVSFDRLDRLDRLVLSLLLAVIFRS